MPARVNNRAPIRAASPVLAACLLAAIIGTGTLNPAAPQGMATYVDNVVQAIDAVPYRIGGWTGADLDAPPPQTTEMLKPSRVLHRGYRESGSGDTVRLVLVHCPNVRDMAGHHPPNCYPATGWTTESSTDLLADAFGSSQRLAVHVFSRMDDTGIPRALTIANAFVVPGVDRELVPTMRSLQRVSENHRQRLLGAAQVQMIFEGRRTPEEIRDAVETFLPALEPVVSRVTEGVS
ncbi:MAG: exosortase-associated EpsI family protein [Phycisphaerales bacterium]